jgi:hypothetical protein
MTTTIEACWHKRFSAKPARGEWFKLTKANVAYFDDGQRFGEDIDEGFKGI